MPYESYTAGEKLTAAKMNERLLSWCYFDGTSPGAIRNSRNVDSISYVSTGIVDVVWDTDFTSTDYCVLVTSENVHYRVGGPPSTGSCRVTTYDNSIVPQDEEDVWVVAFGDQT